MRFRALGVFACLTVACALGGVALLLDAPEHSHDDSDAAVRDVYMRGVMRADTTGKQLVEQLREAGL